VPAMYSLISGRKVSMKALILACTSARSREDPDFGGDLKSGREPGWFSGVLSTSSIQLPNQLGPFHRLHATYQTLEIEQ
jgi:hypothetical protein